MPALPGQLYDKYTVELGLSAYDAGVITAEKDFALYYEELINHTKNYKAAANWLMGPVKSYLNENNLPADKFGISPKTLADLIALVDSGEINYSSAAQKLFPALLTDGNKSVRDLAIQLNLLIIADNNDVSQFIHNAIAKYPDKVKEYKNGKKGVIGLFMGEIMKSSKGKIDPQKTNQLLIQELEAIER